MNAVYHTAPEDAAIWQALRQGNQKAFDQLYDKFFPLLYNYGVRLCQDRALVKDCIQNLFVALWRKKAALNDVHSVKYYLYKSLRHSLVKMLKQENKWLHDEELPGQYTFEVTFPHEWQLVHEQISQENHVRLQQAFGFLTNRQKEAIFLRFYENMDYPQIASLLSLKDVKYARTLVYRALAVLKASIRQLAVI